VKRQSCLIWTVGDHKYSLCRIDTIHDTYETIYSSLCNSNLIIRCIITSKVMQNKNLPSNSCNFLGIPMAALRMRTTVAATTTFY